MAMTFVYLFNFCCQLLLFIGAESAFDPVVCQPDDALFDDHAVAGSSDYSSSTATSSGMLANYS